ncbi:MAG: permease [Ensifer adhaerens]
MDFMRLLKSIEELLYELVFWLLFYPLTMWRTLRHPEAMMRYADVELSDRVAEQYTDTLSPPLFLLITLLLAHGLELAMLTQETAGTLPPLLRNDSNLLMFRAVSFSILPLLMAVKLLRHRGTPLDRNTLRQPFYSQCYVAAPFAFAVSFATLLTRAGNATALVVGLVLLAISFIWYVTIETRWFKSDLGLSAPRAAFKVMVTLLQALMAIIVLGVLIVYGTGTRPV